MRALRVSTPEAVAVLRSGSRRKGRGGSWCRGGKHAFVSSLAIKAALHTLVVITAATVISTITIPGKFLANTTLIRITSMGTIIARMRDATSCSSSRCTCEQAESHADELYHSAA